MSVTDDAARKDLAGRGWSHTVYVTGDILANLHGGLRRGTVEQGKVELAITGDLEKAAGLPGLTFFANGFYITNTGRFRRDYVGGVNTIAAIEADRAVRLSELWLEQALDPRTTVRFGQLAADTEFFFAGLSAMFLQSDWATIAATNMPSGGPAYPLSTPGIRIKHEPRQDTTLLFAVFNGDPAGPGDGDEQHRNRYGLNFRVSDPPLVLGEAQFRRNTGKDDKGLASTLKVGGWGFFGDIKDQYIASDGTTLANPAGSGIPAVHHGTGGIYAVVEQQLYRPAGGAADSGISVFARASYSPADRNPVDMYVDGGIVFAGFVPNRPDDKFGAAFIYTHFVDRARAWDRDANTYGGGSGIVRDFEANIELNYYMQMTPTWIVQPTLQYIFHPSGDERLDAFVVGARTFMRY